MPGRRRPEASSVRHREPRLVLRFAVITAVGLAVAGAVILLVVRHLDTEQAQVAATDKARLVAESVLRDHLRPEDARAPVRGERRRELDDLARRLVLIDGGLRLSLVGRGGRVTYSTDHARIGERARHAGHVAEARNGAIVSEVDDVPDVGSPRTRRALVVYVPVSLAGSAPAVVVLEQDYGPIQRAASESLLPIAGVLEVTLVALFALLVPTLARASRRLRNHVEEISYRAAHDALTGLPNRTMLLDELECVLARRPVGTTVAVLLLDLDRFKEVNDSLGHDAGDELLCAISERLREAVPAGLMTRLGGDEFAMLLPDTSRDTALAAALELRRVIAEPLAVRGVPAWIDASVGVALAPEHGEDTTELLRHADVAMYTAKHSRSGVALYDPALDPNDASRLVLMTELREAIELGELDVYYQPVTEVSSGVVTSVEALVRWHHPVHGLLPPDAFLPLASHTGLILGVNRLVAREAIRQSAAWQAAGIDLGVAVNVTVLDLLDRDFVDDVRTMLEEHGLPPQHLTIEITEDVLMQEPERVDRTVSRLRSAGIRVVIDDFGTGYSSLAYLSRLPVDGLKIDKSFVQALPGDRASWAIVRSVVELAERLGLDVVAEGVETAEQADAVEEAGCDRIQGYLVAPPVPAHELEAWMADGAIARPAA
jgi:diguanylate cyclase (GGDEF)-like protein